MSNNYASPFSGLDTLGRQFFETNPDSAYQLWTGAQGFGPGNPHMDSYARGLNNYFQQDYYGQSARNPGLQWLDYLDHLGQTNTGVGSMWAHAAPSARGVDAGEFDHGVKWVG